MPFTLTTFTLEEQIAATQPTGKHQPTVAMILSDEASGWLNQPLKGNQTLHDYDVTQAIIELDDLINEKKKLEKKITELQAEFAKPPKEGGARLFTKNQLKDSYAALTVCMFQITPARATLKMHTDLQDTARQQLVALRFITNEYKSKKDMVWLEKAVHLACESKNPSSEHIAPIPKPEQPVTAW
jgi:uncharacterized protein YhaN